MSKVYVRIQSKQKNTSRFRCGHQFGKTWTELDGIDAATLAALKADQILDVSETPPADFAAAQTPAREDGKSGNDDAPVDPAARLETIKAAIKSMDRSNPDLFTKDGTPKVPELEKITGWPVSAAERDAAYDAIKKEVE